MKNTVLIFSALFILSPLPALGAEEIKASLDAVQAEVDSLHKVLTSLQEHINQIEAVLDSLKQVVDSGEGLAEEERQVSAQGEEEEEDGKKEEEDAEEEPAKMEVVIVSEEVGEEIDLEERNLYGLFQNVEGFVQASYFKQPDGSYTIKLIRTDEDGNQVEKVNAVSFAGIEFVRSKIKSKKG